MRSPSNIPPVPCHQFLAERDRALDPATGTAVIPLDLSAQLGTGFPATTPLILTRYCASAPATSSPRDLRASGELYYVIAGTGETRNGPDRIAWGPGDVFCLPGGIGSTPSRRRFGLRALGDQQRAASSRSSIWSRRRRTTP